MAATRAADIVPLLTDFSQLIDGELIAGTPALDVINPATGAVFARAPRATRPELDRAVGAARRAFAGWRETSYEQRRTDYRALLRGVAHPAGRPRGIVDARAG